MNNRPQHLYEKNMSLEQVKDAPSSLTWEGGDGAPMSLPYAALHISTPPRREPRVTVDPGPRPGFLARILLRAWKGIELS